MVYDITQGSPTENMEVGSIGYVGVGWMCGGCFCCSCCFLMALVIERVCIVLVDIGDVFELDFGSILFL
jgi:hypothetical protein